MACNTMCSWVVMRMSIPIDVMSTGRHIRCLATILAQWNHSLRCHFWDFFLKFTNKPVNEKRAQRDAVALIRRKIWGGRGHSGQAIKLEADRNSFSFSAPKIGYLGMFGCFRFRPKMNFHFCFIFRFRSKKCHLRWAENVMFATEP